MKIHSIVENITNSSSITYVFPHSDAAYDIKKMFEHISDAIKERYDLKVDFEDMVKVKIQPQEGWKKDQINEGKQESYKMTDEQFEQYLSNPDNAYFEADWNKVPLTDLYVEIDGIDISKFFDLFGTITIEDR